MSILTVTSTAIDFLTGLMFAAKTAPIAVVEDDWQPMLDLSWEEELELLADEPYNARIAALEDAAREMEAMQNYMAHVQAVMAYRLARMEHRRVTLERELGNELDTEKLALVEAEELFMLSKALYMQEEWYAY